MTSTKAHDDPGVLPETEPFTVHVGWAESPEDGQESSEYTFDTQVERDAFLLGINEASGWAGWEVLDKRSFYDDEQGEWVPA